MGGVHILRHGWKYYAADYATICHTNMGVYSIDFHYMTSTSNLLSLWKTENWNPNDAKMRKRKERQERQG
jgi:hypothetical protein